MTYDLIVIGGGPGGCSTAITAARTGAHVLLLESGRYPRHRVCGEFVSAESLALLAKLLSGENRCLIDNAPRISQSRVFADGAPLHLPIEPAAASIPRFDLDRALWESCLEAGVDARQGSPVRYFHGDGPFMVNASGDRFAAKALVNAAGRWSFLTSSAIRDRASDDRWIGVKAHFVEKDPSPTVDLYFCEAGYCGVQPVTPQGMNGGTRMVNACAMFRADVATDLPDIFAAHTALRERSREWKIATDPVRTSPLVFHKPEPVQGTMLQVGDAATFVDPFIGDGISLALRSGALAAESLTPFLQGACALEDSAKHYEELYTRRLAPVFRASSVLRNLLRVPPIIRRPAMSLLQHTRALTRQIVRMTR
jgi:menaquinone-9 beta-reductase